MLPCLSVTLGVLFLGTLLGGGFLAREEMRHATLHSRWVADFAKEITWDVRPGPATAPLLPDRGPWDERLGYAGLPAFSERLATAGYAITRQAEPSRRMTELAGLGFFNAYEEKSQAGLELRDANGARLQQARYPRNVYGAFDDVPDLVARALLYVEDRELLDPSRPTMNPVVDWDRFGMAVVQQGLKAVGLEHRSFGASTLATQLEKFRHSPGGITHDGKDKLRQMASATLRVYRGGAENLPARRRLLLDYLNSLPLAAQPGYGEVSSLGDGLQAWFGSDFAEVNRVLANPEAPIEQRALHFKQVLALVLAVRRPSYYLGHDAAALEQLTDSHLRRMAREQVIPASLASAAERQPLQLRERASVSPLVDFTQQKGLNLARTQLLGLLGVKSLYELDRIDLAATTTLDASVQREVTGFLRSLAKPERIAELGLDGEKLLRADDPAKLVYSFTLYERGEGMNRLRVNADNLDQPLDINAGAKLDLGSTAKLRTLVSWLELIAAAHARYSGLAEAEQGRASLHPKDRLSGWVLDYLAANPGAGLRETLEA
ncbi:MAG: transglycosylase domain-containing protein, partial [Gammaproteobacteria bacterium]